MKESKAVSISNSEYNDPFSGGNIQVYHGEAKLPEFANIIEITGSFSLNPNNSDLLNINGPKVSL